MGEKINKTIAIKKFFNILKSNYQRGKINKESLALQGEAINV